LLAVGVKAQVMLGWSMQAQHKSGMHFLPCNRGIKYKEI